MKTNIFTWDLSCQDSLYLTLKEMAEKKWKISSCVVLKYDENGDAVKAVILCNN